jgi:hypothetical protein
MSLANGLVVALAVVALPRPASIYCRETAELWGRSITRRILVGRGKRSAEGGNLGTRFLSILCSVSLRWDGQGYRGECSLSHMHFVEPS